MPHSLTLQSTCDPPDAVGVAFAADVLKRERQLILVLRETVTSYTRATIIDSEKKDSLREALISLCIELRPFDGPIAVIRTDPAPGFGALVNDELLQSNRMTIEIGRVKNVNKNPVAERAVQEVEEELLKQNPSGGHVSALALAITLACLNSRIRSRGLSAREMWTQRDQFNNAQIPITDRKLVQDQHDSRLENHPHSEKSKAPQRLPIHTPVAVGDLIYINTDRNKSRARDRYLVVSVDGGWCNVRKFVGTQLRSNSYRIKLSECYKVPEDPNTANLQNKPNRWDTYSSDCEEDPLPTRMEPPPVLPHIPQELILPASAPEAVAIRAPSEYIPDSDFPSATVNTQQELVHENVLDVLDVSTSGPRRSSRSKKQPKHLNDYVI